MTWPMWLHSKRCSTSAFMAEAASVGAQDWSAATFEGARQAMRRDRAGTSAQQRMQWARRRPAPGAGQRGAGQKPPRASGAGRARVARDAMTISRPCERCSKAIIGADEAELLAQLQGASRPYGYSTDRGVSKPLE